jgi:hypothetical protein
MSDNVININLSPRYTEPVTKAEKRVYGEDAERDPMSGFIFETGSGSHPRHVQAALFQQRLSDVEWLELFMQSDPNWSITHPDLGDRVRALKAGGQK